MALSREKEVMATIEEKKEQISALRDESDAAVRLKGTALEERDLAPATLQSRALLLLRSHCSSSCMYAPANGGALRMARGVGSGGEGGRGQVGGYGGAYR